MNPPNSGPKSTPDPSPTDRQPERVFRVVNQTPQEEDNFDYSALRVNAKTSGIIGTVAHMVKGSLGAGILSAHVAYMKTGIYVAGPLTVFFGIYMGYCLDLLVRSAQILYRRTHLPSMSYPDVGEAAMACFPNPNISKYSKHFRYLIDALIIIDLFGACACYQIIIAKSIKQLVENAEKTSIEGQGGYPGLRLYLAIMILPIICICLIRHLKWLAPFSVAANFVVLICIFMTIYYAVLLNPTFSNMKTSDSLASVFEFIGMIVFGLSCSGVVLPVENNMRDPKQFSLAFSIGMTCIIVGTFMVAFFGYAGFLEDCESPITVNFPMTPATKCLKALIAIMIFFTHALNFWVPFNLLFHYIQKRHPKDIVMWEMIYRAIFVCLIGIVAIAFPNINALLGFIGTLCLSNIAIIWPNMIFLLVNWHRPGLGKGQWRLWRSVLLIVVGIFVLICGSYVNGRGLIKTLLA